MTRPRIYLDPLPAGERFSLGAESAHLLGRVLRCRSGDELELFDGRGRCRRATLERLSAKEAALSGQACQESPKPRPAITLFQALPKADVFDSVLHKATELGAERIIPVISERTVRRPDQAKLPRLLARWRSIAVEACRQSGRNWLPLICAPMNVDEALALAAGDELGLFFWEESQGVTLVDGLLKRPLPLSLSLLIGPEGGFSEAEAEAARKKGLLTLSLGPNVLKVDTAATLAVGALILLGFCRQNR